MDKLTGHGRPTNRTPGEVNQIYEDLDTGDIYECRISSEYSPTHGWPVGGYIWELRAKGEDIKDIYKVYGASLPEGGVGYGERNTIRWEYTENTEGLVVVGGAIVKVSDLTPSIKELEGGTVSFSGGANEKVMLTAYGESPQLADIGGAILATDVTIIVYSDNFVLEGLAFPEKGIYMPNVEGQTIELSYGTIHKIDPKYLPGVCLPVVDLTRCVSGEAITDVELSAQLDAIAKNPVAVIAKIATDGVWMYLVLSGTAPAFFAVVFRTENVDVGFATSLNGNTVALYRDNGAWTFMGMS